MYYLRVYRSVVIPPVSSSKQSAGGREGCITSVSLYKNAIGGYFKAFHWWGAYVSLQEVSTGGAIYVRIGLV